MEELAIIKELTETTARSKSNLHQIDELKKRQENLDNLVAAVSTLGTKYESLDSDVKEIKSDVKMLTEKPAKRWESVVEKIILVVVGGIIGWLLQQIGMS